MLNRKKGSFFLRGNQIFGGHFFTRFFHATGNFPCWVALAVISFDEGDHFLRDDALSSMTPPLPSFLAKKLFSRTPEKIISHINIFLVRLKTKRGILRHVNLHTKMVANCDIWKRLVKAWLRFSVNFQYFFSPCVFFFDVGFYQSLSINCLIFNVTQEIPIQLHSRNICRYHHGYGFECL